MEGFSYNNIFESKGIEYLAIIAFFIVLVPFWYLMNRQRKLISQIRGELRFLSANILKIPQGVFYCKNHTWAFLEKSGNAKVGLDDLLLHITGEVKLSNARMAGETIRKGDLMAELEQDGKTLSVYAPITGEIVEKNDSIFEEPGILNGDPYGKGWFYKIKPQQWKEDTSTYFLAEEATSWLSKEVVRFKDFLSLTVKKYDKEPSAVILQDGGEISDNALSEMPPEAWKDFQKDFMAI